MRVRVLALSIASAVILTGCTSNKPEPLPTTPAPSVSASAPITEAPTPEPTVEPGPDTTEPETPSEPDPKPTPAPATSEAGTPSVEFIKRWGLKYISVEEYRIQKAANATCKVITTEGSTWDNNPETVSAVEAIVVDADIAKSDALEFGQDAYQNYCPSMSNPT